MRAIKADRPRLNNYSDVQTLHGEILSLVNEMPAFLRLQNPDSSWDLEHPYLPPLRLELQVMLNLVLMALHRPYLVSHGESRRAALQAALQTLDCQHRFFAQDKKSQYHLFGLSFYTVDASFLISMIVMLFPPSSLKAKQKIDQALQQAIEDLSHMQSSNSVARSGLDILQRSYQRVKIICEPNDSTLGPRSGSFSTPGVGLTDLIDDLGLQNPASPQPGNAWSGSAGLIPQPIPDIFDQRYWLDQLNMIQPSTSDQDAGVWWENIYFD